VLRTLRTTAGRHLRALPTGYIPTQLLPLLIALALGLAQRLAPAYARVAFPVLPRRLSMARRFMRQMAVPLVQPAVAGPAQARPMAVPFDATEPSYASMLVAAAALAFAMAGLWRQDAVIEFTHVAMDGLGSSGVLPTSVDQADVPAMDPGLAAVVDPRPQFISPLLSTQRGRTPIKPFEYQVREGDTLDEIARRFGTDADAILWNNGLDTADQVEVGANLMVLPVRGLLHLVKPGDTVNKIAERYNIRPEDLAIANALDNPNHIVPDQVIVVAGARVPAPPTAATAPSGTLPQLAAIIGLGQASDDASKLGPQPAPTATPGTDENLPNPSGANRWQREFILKIAPGARQSQRETGVPASVTLAQAILESDWGRSRLSMEANNLFGIKAQRGPGSAGVYNISTWEVSGGDNIMVMAGFKAYQSVADSIVDHGRWFHDNSRYHGALKVTDDPRAFARAIADAGYATDPAYPGKLIGLMDKYDLYAYDLQP
jgi:LysM repeat protein